jgi:hypothetical protein
MNSLQGFTLAQLPRSIWGVSLSDFIGPTVISEAFLVTGDEEELHVYFEAEPARQPIWSNEDYAIHAVADRDFKPDATVLLRYGGQTIGFYAGGMCWIDRAHRGKELSTPLIVAANLLHDAVPYTEHVGSSPAGLAAHEAAHRWTVNQALEAGLPVPPEVASANKDYAGTPMNRRP